MMPTDGPATLARHDAILHEAMGPPNVPDTVSSNEGHLRIRNESDHYVNRRPVRLFDGVESRLRRCEREGEIVIDWYRENGGYLNIGGTVTLRGHSEMSLQSTVFNHKGVERIAREAFEVVVAPNLFSDILTDLTAAVTGGLGIAPSVNYNPANDKPPMFEPVHGSTPDTAGQGVANPLASVLPSAMLFDHLGDPTPAADLRDAVSGQLADPDAPRTPDLCGAAGTVDAVEGLQSRVAHVPGLRPFYHTDKRRGSTRVQAILRVGTDSHPV